MISYDLANLDQRELHKCQEQLMDFDGFCNVRNTLEGNTCRLYEVNFYIYIK